MATKTMLPLPDYSGLSEENLRWVYDPANAENWSYRPDHRALFETAQRFREDHGIRAAATDDVKVHLLLIDLQKDFCFPEGALYVGGRSGRGAIEDSQRTVEFIYRNIDRLSAVTVTLDTHFPFQIFTPAFWVDEDGTSLKPHDVIAGDLTIMRGGAPAGKASVNPAVCGWLCNGNLPWLQRQAADYCRKLEEGGKYQLYIWPEHCVLGSEGHTLVGVVHEARMFHSYVRNIQARAEIKGGNPLTENYSVLGPEVLTRHDGGPLAEKNRDFIQKLLTADAVVIAGQAASHCVKSSIDDLLDEILASDPSLAEKVYILEDCTSAVTVPDGKGGFIVDFTAQAEDAFTRYRNAGMHLVKSTDPMETWPGFPGTAI